MSFTTDQWRGIPGYPPLNLHGVITIRVPMPRPPAYDLEFSMAEGTLQRYRGTDTSFAHWRDDWEWEGGVESGWATATDCSRFGTPVLWRSFRRAKAAIERQSNQYWRPHAGAEEIAL